MSTFPALAKIADQVKIDVVYKTHAIENANKIKEISRTFICEIQYPWPFVNAQWAADTITVPTTKMYAYAVLSTLGDDVYFEPSTAALEAHMAKLTGKEAALFMPSGSASNQIALRAHLKQPPYSVLCDHRAHIHKEI